MNKTQLLGSFDLAGLTTQAIEGVTVDERGLIDMEPEPQTQMLLGLVALGAAARRRG